VRERFDIELKTLVNLKMFTQRNIGGLYIPGRECKTCAPTQQLLEELVVLSPNLQLETVDFWANQEEAVAHGVEMIPATIIGGDDTHDVRFYGLPSGFEFALLLDTIVAASSKRGPLSIETRRSLKRLEEDVHIRVFVTPTCQYCPAVARLAYAMAMESSRVAADVVEVQEFPHLAQAHRVMGVPKTVINDTVEFTGAVSEEVFLRRVLTAVGAAEPDADEEPVSGQTTPVS
jgi:glutaredoxin-like protein